MPRIQWFVTVCVSALFLGSTTARKYRVGAFYYGPWHVDPTNEQLHGKNWTEWQLVKVRLHCVVLYETVTDQERRLARAVRTAPIFRAHATQRSTMGLRNGQ